MAEVTNELMFELLKNLQTRLTNIEMVSIEQAHGLNAMRGHFALMQTDSTNVYSILTRIDQRLDRIERRLELRELAEPRAPYEPT